MRIHGPPDKHIFVDYLQPSATLEKSDVVTFVMFAAEKCGAYPVFLSTAERIAVEYRLRKLEKGYPLLIEQYPDIFPYGVQNTKIGELKYSIASSLFSPELLAAKTPGEILILRKALAESRERYLIEQLSELNELISTNEWGPALHRQVQNYVEGKLNRELLKYEEDCRRIWEQLFGKLSVNLSEIASAAMIGGGAGGILGTIIPHAHSWEMLLFGAAIGTAKQLPQLTKNVVEAILGIRAQRRNSIAYLSRLK